MSVCIILSWQPLCCSLVFRPPHWVHFLQSPKELRMPNETFRECRSYEFLNQIYQRDFLGWERQVSWLPQLESELSPTSWCIEGFLPQLDDSLQFLQVARPTWQKQVGMNRPVTDKASPLALMHSLPPGCCCVNSPHCTLLMPWTKLLAHTFTS